MGKLGQFGAAMLGVVVGLVLFSVPSDAQLIRRGGPLPPKPQLGSFTFSGSTAYAPSVASFGISSAERIRFNDTVHSAGIAVGGVEGYTQTSGGISASVPLTVAGGSAATPGLIVGGNARGIRSPGTRSIIMQEDNGGYSIEVSLANQIMLTGAVTPDGDNTRDIGTLAGPKRWANIYALNMQADSSMAAAEFSAPGGNPAQLTYGHRNGNTAGRQGRLWPPSTLQTTDATVSTLATFALTDNRVSVFSCQVDARGTAGVERAGYELKAVFYRQGGGGATLQGSVTTTTIAETTASMDATMDASGNNARIRVTGIAATTLNWDDGCLQLERD